MSSYSGYGELLLEEKERSGEYNFDNKKVSLEGSFEEYYPQTSFTWAEEAVVVQSDKYVDKFIKSYFTELNAIDENGNNVWIDGRNAPYDGCWDGHYLEGRRPAFEYSIVRYNLETKEKEEYEAFLKSKTKMDEYEIAKYVQADDESISFEDLEYIVTKINSNPNFYEKLSDELKSDLSFNIELLDRVYNSRFLDYIDKKYLNDFDFAKKVCLKFYDGYAKISDRLKENIELIKIALTKDGTMLEFMPDYIKDDESMVLKALKSRNDSFEFASDRIKDNKEFVLKIIPRYSSIFQYISSRLKGDRDVVKPTMKYDYGYYHMGGNFFEEISPELQNDKDIVIEGIERGIINFNIFTCKNISDEIKNDKEFAKVVLKKDGRGSFHLLSEQSRNDIEIASLAVRQEVRNIQYVSDKNILLQLLKEDNNLYYYLSKEYMADEDIKRVCDIGDDEEISITVLESLEDGLPF